jgi:hypothetical protein
LKGTKKRKALRGNVANPAFCQYFLGFYKTDLLPQKLLKTQFPIPNSQFPKIDNCLITFKGDLLPLFAGSMTLQNTGF